MTFELKGQELLDYEEFRKKHKECKFTSTIGGKFTFIFTPNGLGDSVSIRCNACGKEEDITDISNW